jgi:hypothetical protein
METSVATVLPLSLSWLRRPVAGPDRRSGRAHADARRVGKLVARRIDGPGTPNGAAVRPPRSCTGLGQATGGIGKETRPVEITGGPPRTCHDAPYPGRFFSRVIAKTKPGKEAGPGQCSARPRADDAARRRFAAIRKEKRRPTSRPPLHYLCSVSVWPSGYWLPLSYFERAKQVGG